MCFFGELSALKLQVQGATVEVSLLEGEEEEAYWEESNRTPSPVADYWYLLPWLPELRGNARKPLRIQKARERTAKARKAKAKGRPGPGYMDPRQIFHCVKKSAGKEGKEQKR